MLFILTFCNFIYNGMYQKDGTKIVGETVCGDMDTQSKTRMCKHTQIIVLCILLYNFFFIHLTLAAIYSNRSNTDFENANLCQIWINKFWFSFINKFVKLSKLQVIFRYLVSVAVYLFI